jgi:hypothetical protein
MSVSELIWSMLRLTSTLTFPPLLFVIVVVWSPALSSHGMSESILAAFPMFFVSSALRKASGSSNVQSTHAGPV